MRNFRAINERVQCAMRRVSRVYLVELFERVIARHDAADVEELGAGRHHLHQKLLEDALLRQLVRQTCSVLLQLFQLRPQSTFARHSDTLILGYLCPLSDIGLKTTLKHPYIHQWRIQDFSLGAVYQGA